MKLIIPTILSIVVAFTTVPTLTKSDGTGAQSDLKQLSQSIGVSQAESSVVRLHYEMPTFIGKREEAVSQFAYEANRHIFGSDLPANKTGWVENGYAFSFWRKIPYVSVNPKTGKKRKHLGLCQHKKPKIPDDSECCRNSVFWAWCRTYKKISKRDAVVPLLLTAQSTTLPQLQSITVKRNDPLKAESSND